MADDEFTPRPGRIRQAGSRPARRFTKSLLAKVERAGGSRRLRRRGNQFTGARTGRGLGARHGFRGIARRRVIVKIRLVTFGKGTARLSSIAAARAHLSYLQRESAVAPSKETELDVGSDLGLDEPSLEDRGRFYNAQHDGLNGQGLLETSADDRHQFRIIVSPEDGSELASLQDFTRDLMRGVEQDLDTKLDWIAVDHFNTGHPHSHIVLRGKDDRGKDLIIARDYIRHGLRQQAEQALTRELGPRPTRQITASLKAEINQERFTSLDRDLLRISVAGDVTLSASQSAYDRFRAHLRIARLQYLQKIGLARSLGQKKWRLSEGVRDTLTKMGEHGDIIRTMQRAFATQIDRRVFDPTNPAQRSVTGTLLAAGLRDDGGDGKYLILDGDDGRHWYAVVPVDQPLPAQSGKVELAAKTGSPKPSDLTIDRIARRYGGIYSSTNHVNTDGPQSDAFLLAHKRRLEALRRKNIVSRNADGSWTIPGDYLRRVSRLEGKGITVKIPGRTIPMPPR